MGLTRASKAPKGSALPPRSLQLRPHVTQGCKCLHPSKRWDGDALDTLPATKRGTATLPVPSVSHWSGLAQIPSQAPCLLRFPH
eukprot:scaffold317267_cov21-Tisochrysis_lutea.AAC.1